MKNMPGICFEEFLSRFKSVKGSRGQWSAQCPAHDDTTPSLSITLAPNGKVLLCCHAGCAVTEILDAVDLSIGDLFSSDGNGARNESLRRAGTRSAAKTRTICVKPHQDFSELAAQFQSAISKEGLERFARLLRVSANSLARLGTGWASREALAKADTKCRGEGAWSFPMHGAAGDAVGIRLRGPDGGKFAVVGSRQGLFILANPASEEPLFICEGPTDTAAILDFGLNAIGRPSCNGGAQVLVYCVKKLRPNSVVVVSDNDEPGQMGARSLALKLAPHCLTCRIIAPPKEISDAREWMSAGATKATILDAMDNVDPIRLRVSVGRQVGHA